MYLLCMLSVYLRILFNSPKASHYFGNKTIIFLAFLCGSKIKHQYAFQLLFTYYDSVLLPCHSSIPIKGGNSNAIPKWMSDSYSKEGGHIQTPFNGTALAYCRSESDPKYQTRREQTSYLKINLLKIVSVL